MTRDTRDQRLGDAAEERERPLMRADPVRQALRPGGLGEGVVRRAEDRDKGFGGRTSPIARSTAGTAGSGGYSARARAASPNSVGQATPASRARFR